ncbi:MAG: hypothetical protein A3B23_01155 [Candidatus Colwellbacteria bacterium RIFCSPLOWO2_01_FULL_48_10]|uniref:Ribonuclease n=1 Tax=Candidatus Colwellbacteria bacterium RIFCSPLOWO2_01_FULL_48_10 TaxID=1797690 RepID=A0A1G1Z7B7_9BACT|nr:MAG: hypothetical protein A3B23_01155 [Candidatus Colwellbacteria bacterium RIFCSPLOWO2_01_FULL_48_10]
MSYKFVIGIDEVGRGSLAGPVVVAAFAAPLKSKIKNPWPGRQRSKLRLRDSKKLSPKQREEWFEYIKSSSEFVFATRSVSPRVIDKINISAAANLAAHRALRHLIKTYKLSAKNYKLFLDGGLYIKNKTHQAKFFVNAETVIRGDEKISAVALASIVAKVLRDRHMVKLHKKYPVYSFDVHKGYGTEKHRAIIQRLGITPIHRLTFCEKLSSISKLKNQRSK